MCGQLAAVEIACGSFVEVEKIVVVDPFEVEQLQDRLAHADVGEKRPARVEYQSLHALWQPIGKSFFNDAAVAERRKIVRGLPTPGIGFQTQVVEALFERFKMGVAVAIVVKPDGIEIP